MTPARLLLCLLATAGLALPALAQDAAAPGTLAEKPVAAKTAIARVDEPLPPNAPKEDYEFVGWCAGVLTGHMALYDRVQPTLKEISRRWKTEERDEISYEAQQKVGRDLLSQFAEAMRSAEKASTQALAPRGVRAIAQGRDMWASIDTIDDNAKAYSWLNFGLPVRCETIAGKLNSRSTLMGALLRDNSESAVQTSAVRAVGARPDAAPAKTAPKPAAADPVPVAPTVVEQPLEVKPKAVVAVAPDKTPATVAPKPAPAKAATPVAAKPAAVKPAPKPATTPPANPAKAAGLR